MKKSKLLISLTIFFAIVAIISSVIAYKYIRWDWMTIEEKGDIIRDKISDGLELNEQQDILLIKLTEETVNKIRSQKSDRLQIKNEYIELVISDIIDRQRLMELSRKSNGLDFEIKELSDEGFIQLHRTLNKKQKQKVLEYTEESFVKYYK